LTWPRPAPVPDTGKEQFGGSDGLAGTAVLHRPVHDKVMVPGAGQHPPEGIGGSCLHGIFTHVGLSHGSPPESSRRLSQQKCWRSRAKVASLGSTRMHFAHFRGLKSNRWASDTENGMGVAIGTSSAKRRRAEISLFERSFPASCASAPGLFASRSVPSPSE